MNKISRDSFKFGDMTEDHRFMLNVWNLHQVEGLNFFYDTEDDTYAAAIIDGANNSVTQATCEEHGLVYKVMPTFNVRNRLAPGSLIEIKNIVLTPEHGDQAWCSHVKLMNHNLTYDQVCRVLDHMMVWNQVIVKGKPRAVLESGVKVYRKIEGTMPKNTILALDTNFTVNAINPNYVCMMGVHAYVVDQYSARALFNQVMTMGIIEPLEQMFRMDQYCCLPYMAACRS